MRRVMLGQAVVYACYQIKSHTTKKTATTSTKYDIRTYKGYKVENRPENSVQSSQDGSSKQNKI